MYSQRGSHSCQHNKLKLVRQRDDKAYNSFYSSMVVQAKEYTDDPVLPRYKRIPKRLDDGQYYEVLDLRFLDDLIKIHQQLKTY